VTAWWPGGLRGTARKEPFQVDRRSEKGAANVLAAHVVTMEQRAELIVVRAAFSDEASLSSREKSRLQVSYKVSVPSHFNLDLKTAGGHIAVGDLKGNIKAETAGGEFRFGRIDGTIRAQTAGGSISLSRATGPVTLRTAGGRISIGEARAGVQAQTAGGSISAALAAQPEGDCRLSTSGGRIEVELASDLELDITAQTSGGRVEVDVPLSAVESRSRSWLRAKMNGGGPTLSLQTSGGSITLKKL
jgi:DUF4097 and DUF4098 domain-containing protein YvlB